jgi:hypothetical protein
MSHVDFPLLCGRGGNKTISFHALYLNISNQLHESVESSIIPYRSVCYVFEEHLNTGDTGLRRMNIHLYCGEKHTIESNNAQQAEEILMNLLKNTLVQTKVAP